MSSNHSPLFATDELPASFPKSTYQNNPNKAPAKTDNVKGLRRPISEHRNAIKSMTSAANITSFHQTHNDSDADESEYGATQDDDSLALNSGSGSHSNNQSDRTRTRVKGGRAALAKRVTLNLDSDDEIIKTMKDKGQPDINVRDRLINEGRTKYAEKSISTRYARIKRFFDEHDAEVLDEDLSDWHEGDDDKLQEAHRENETWLNAEVARIHAKHWQAVAESLKNKMPTPRFSKNACKDRFNALANGTADPPLELDPDQEGRMNKRILRAAEQNRRKAEAATKAREESEIQRQADKEAERKTTETAAKKTEQEAVRAEAKAQKEAERIRKIADELAKTEANKQAKADEARIRKTASEARAQEKAIEMQQRQNKARNKQKAKDAKAALAARAEIERLAVASAAARKKLDMLQRDKEDAEVMKKTLTAAMEKEDDEESNLKGTLDIRRDKLGDEVRRTGGLDDSGDDDEDFKVPNGFTSVNSIGLNPKTTNSFVADASENALRAPASSLAALNPYLELTVAALHGLCRNRNLSVHGDKVTAAVRLRRADNAMTDDEILDFYRVRDLAPTGTEAEQRHVMMSVFIKEAWENYGKDNRKKRPRAQNIGSEGETSSVMISPSKKIKSVSDKAKRTVVVKDKTTEPAQDQNFRGAEISIRNTKGKNDSKKSTETITSGEDE